MSRTKRSYARGAPEPSADKGSASGSAANDPVHIEFGLAPEDAELLRAAARALKDPACAPDARAILTQLGALAAPPGGLGFKEFLTSVSFEGVDLERRRDFARDIEL